MNHKLLRDIALVMLAVFVITILVYPYIFGTNLNPKSPAPALEVKTK